ncbi:MAG: hypothetical protein OEZ65_17045 [Gemmatimonadota bacterium]|nr:hypothetical protein [Gemmatimonadota bacterium]
MDRDAARPMIPYVRRMLADAEKVCYESCWVGSDDRDADNVMVDVCSWLSVAEAALRGSGEDEAVERLVPEIFHGLLPHLDATKQLGHRAKQDEKIVFEVVEEIPEIRALPGDAIGFDDAIDRVVVAHDVTTSGAAVLRGAINRLRPMTEAAKARCVEYLGDDFRLTITAPIPGLPFESGDLIGHDPEDTYMVRSLTEDVLRTIMAHPECVKVRPERTKTEPASTPAPAVGFQQVVTDLGQEVGHA